jgi:RNA polymerase-binding transcription factor DksA
VGQADPAPNIQLRKNSIVEKSPDVLEELWRTADRERSKAGFTSRAGLVSMVRAALASMNADLFGACLCCKATLGLSRMKATPWTALCTRCQEAADCDDAEVLRIRSRGSRR